MTEARSKAALRPPTTDPARSAIMRAVKSTNTRPEMIIRSLAHRLGYRFRLHRKTLPGCPDLVFATRRKAIFVNGCFWHGHDCKRGARAPKANAAYWRAKIARNIARDAQANSALLAAGWDVLIIWECEIKDAEALRDRLRAFLDGPLESAIKSGTSGKIASASAQSTNSTPGSRRKIARSSRQIG